jgi:nickel-dependent lactate racemase
MSLGPLRVAGVRGSVPLAVDRRLVEADLRIVVAGASPHLQAGFGGGEKMFVPGCASLETIARLHNLGLPRIARPLVGEGNDTNPMRRLIDAAGRRIAECAGETFAVQYLLDADDQPTDLTAGRLARGQRMLAKKCAASAGVMVDQPADIVIANAAPRDFDLWQSFKCIANTCWAARENGVLVVLARCPGGLNMPSPSAPISPRWLRRIIRLLGARSLAGLFNRLASGAHGETQFFVRLALETLERTPILLYSPQLAGEGVRFPGLPIFGDLEAVWAEAETLLGDRGRRAVCFPLGGASYPVLRTRAPESSS